MISMEIESPVWSRRRWLAMIALALILQVGLILWLGERKGIKPRPPPKGPVMYLPADQAANLPGLSDPTLFVLANRHGFSGAAWLNVPLMEYHLKEWTETEPLPALSPELGGTLNEFVRGNLSQPFEVARKPEPQLDTIQYSPPLDTAQSTLTIDGELASRPLLSVFKLDSWPAAEILTNSEVLVAVNPEGTVFSAVLLAKCGPKDDPGAGTADSNALNLAKSARFKPLQWSGPGQPAAPASRLTWGRLVFHWCTSAPSATNTASKTP